MTQKSLIALYLLLLIMGEGISDIVLWSITSNQLQSPVPKLNFIDFQTLLQTKKVSTKAWEKSGRS